MNAHDAALMTQLVNRAHRYGNEHGPHAAVDYYIGAGDAIGLMRSSILEMAFGVGTATAVREAVIAAEADPQVASSVIVTRLRVFAERIAATNGIEGEPGFWHRELCRATVPEWFSRNWESYAHEEKEEAPAYDTPESVDRKMGQAMSLVRRLT